MTDQTKTPVGFPKNALIAADEADRTLARLYPGGGGAGYYHAIQIINDLHAAKSLKPEDIRTALLNGEPK